MSRRPYLDWLRGVAVLIMIEAHTLDAWTRPDARSHPLYDPLIVLAGFGAPAFLFLAGVTLALAAGSRQRRGKSDSEVAALARRRALRIFGLAFLFRFQSWLISGGGLASLLKVDILNIMGLAMLAGAGLWGWGSSRRTRAGLMAAGAIACAMITPLVREWAALSPLPDRIEAYARPVAGRTTFSLFPWAGFLLAGGAVGLWLDAVIGRRDERRTVMAVAGLGALVAVGGYSASYLPPIYEQTDYWRSSPTFFLVRVGILMSSIGLAYAWTAFRLPGAAAELLGRSSLFVYWVHVEIVYGVVSSALHRQLPFWGAISAFLLFTGFMYVLARLKDRLISLRTTRAAAQTSAV